MIEPYYRSLGARVRKAREHAGLSQAELGRMLKPQVTRASIANIEAAKQRCLAHTVVQLARALQCPVLRIATGGIK
jgi:ribosome-binding protein aMBF1 (putative translation factor)